MKAFLLRKEYFGGTLFSVKSGKRVYISADEFSLMEKSEVISKPLAKEIGETGEVKVVCPSFLPESSFSSPDTIFLEITRSCNLFCKHCFNASGRKMDEEMEFEKQAVVINDCAVSGVQEIRFTGGEPMVFNRIYDLIHIASKNNLRVSMGTNGTLIDQESAAKLSLCGLNMVIISIDGTEKSHDAVRGQGNFQKSIKGIMNLRKQGINVRVNIVAMKSNIGDIPKMVEFFHKLGVNIFVRRFIPLGRSTDNVAAFLLNQEEYKHLRNEIEMYLEEPTGNVRGHYLKEDNVVMRIQLPFTRRSCSAGQRALVIDPCGNIQLCGFMDQKSVNFFGNITDESLSQIWRRIFTEDPVRNLEGILESHNAACSNITTNCFAIALASRVIARKDELR